MASSDADGAHTPLLSSTPCPPEAQSRAASPQPEHRQRADDEAAFEADHAPPGTSTLPTAAAVRKRLYASHFLSTWNARVFEFGAVLYLATIYPGDLRPMSVYALSRQAAGAVLGPAVGRYIDGGDRLDVVRLSIVLQRVTVGASCVLFWLLATGWWWGSGWMRWGALAVLAAFACVEKLCAIMNLVAVERDWVIVIADGDEGALRVLNAQMRRIDLVCKLAGPFSIAMLDGAASTSLAILVNLGMNLFSIPVEYFAIARVYRTVPALRQPKRRPPPEARDGPVHHHYHRPGIGARLFAGIRGALDDVRAYFGHGAVLPSFAGALLYLTVLSFSGQMVTYLLSAGYGSVHIAVARTVSVGFELSATVVGPAVMGRIGAVRAGIWFVTWQSLCLGGGAAVFWGAAETRPVVAASGLVVGAVLSRVGLWGYDLCAQVIVQEEVEAERRGAFSAVEASWQSAFELCSYASTVVFSRPDQFQWPVLLSCVAVFSAGGLYASFVRMRRGHLLHFSKCIEHRAAKPRQDGPAAYERLVQSPNV